MSVELTRREDCAVLILNRPEALNALSVALLRQLEAAFEEVVKSRARALIITGAGNKAFCAGADIKEFRDQTMLDSKARTQLGQATFAKLDRLPIASIAVLNGYAFGGGLELALAATFRLALPNAKLGQPEIKLGTIPGYGGTQRLPRLIGDGMVRELAYTGRKVGAEEAARIGLVNRVFDTPEALLEGVMKLAYLIAAKSPLAVRGTKDTLNYARDHSVADGLDRVATWNAAMLMSEDLQAAIRAGMTRQAPKFRD